MMPLQHLLVELGETFGLAPQLVNLALLLLIGLPVYIVAVVTVVNWLDRPPIWLELLVYIGLGVLWALPFKFVFRGVGKEDPDQNTD